MPSSQEKRQKTTKIKEQKIMIAKIRAAFTTLSLFGVPKAKSILNTILAYLTLVGVISFSLFIGQEACQMTSFGNFSASDTRRYDLMKQNLSTMSNILSGMVWINKPLVILNPFQYWAYESYIKATRNYIETLEAEIFANEPGLFSGEQVSSLFTYQSYQPAKNGLYVAINKRVKVILSEPPESRSIQVAGTARPDPDKDSGIIIDTTQ